MADEVGNLQVKLSLDKSGFSSGLKAAETEADSMGKRLEGKFSALGSAIGGALVTGAKAMSVGAALGTGYAVKAAADQEQAFMRVNKIMNLNEEQQKQMAKSYRELSNTYGQATTDIADAGANLAATGLFDNMDDLVKGTDALIKVSAAWGMEMETTSKYLSQTATGYGLNADGMERYGSAVAVLADSTGASEEQIARGAVAFVGLRRELNMSLDDVNGFTAAFAELGIQPEHAETQLRSMFQTFTSGTKPSIAAMQRLGFTTAQYDKAVREGKLPELFAQVGLKLRGVTSEMERATLAGNLFGAYGRSMANTLPDLIDEYQKYSQASAQAYQENARASDEAAKALDTFYGQLNRSKEIVRNFMAEVGDRMLQPLTDGLYTLNAAMIKAFSGDIPGAIQIMKDAFNNFDFSGMIQNITTRLGAMGATLLATLEDVINRAMNLDWASMFDNAVGAISGAMNTIGNAIVNAPWGSWAQRGVSIFLSGLSAMSSLGGNLVNWITSAYNNLDMGAIRSAGQNMANSLIAGAKSIDFWGALVGGITVLGSAGSVLVELGAGIATAIYESAKSWLSGKWASLIDFGSAGLDAARSWGSAIAGAIGAGLSDAANLVLKPLETMINKAGGAIGGLASKIPGMSDYKFTPVSLTLDTSGNAAKYEALKSKMAGISGWDPIKDWGGSLPTGAGISTVTGKTYEEMGLTEETAAIVAQAAKLGVDNKDPYSFMRVAGASGMNLDSAQAYLNANLGNMVQNQSYVGQSGLKEYYSGKMQYLAGNMYGKDYHGGAPAAQSLLAGTGTESNPLVTKDVGVQTMISGPAAKIPDFYNWNPAAGGVTAAAAGPTATQLAQQAYNAKNDDPFGILPNLKQFSSELVKASAEGAGFCEAISELGYMQEHAEGLFQESYIGPTSGWAGAAGGADPVATASQAKGVTIGGANTAKGITVGAAKDAAGITIGSTYQNSAIQTQTQTQLNAQARIANDNKLAAEAATCGIWDEANARWTANAERIAQIQSEAAGKENLAAQDFKEKMGATSGKWEESSLNVTNGLSKWSETHIANMNKFDETLNAHLSGTFSGMAAAFSGGQVNYMSETTGGGGTGAPLAANQYAIAYNNAAKSISSSLLTLGAVQKGTSDLGNFGYGKIGGQYGSAYSGWYSGGAGISNGSGWGAQASAAAQSGSASGLAGYSVRWFADGGVVNKPQIVGVGEAGPEAIVPVDQLPGMIQKVMGGGAGGAQMVHTVINVDGRKLADVTGPAIIKRVQQAAGLKVR